MRKLAFVHDLMSYVNSIAFGLCVIAGGWSLKHWMGEAADYTPLDVDCFVSWDNAPDFMVFEDGEGGFMKVHRSAYSNVLPIVVKRMMEAALAGLVSIHKVIICSNPCVTSAPLVACEHL